jgi:putative cardiolipin synthase
LKRRISLVGLLLVAVGLDACSTIPPGANSPRHFSTAFTEPQKTPLGRQFEAASRKEAGKSAFRIISNGIDGFAAREQMIAAATKSLDLQYYIFHQDQTGRFITLSLLRAADSGVHVRLLIDDGETLPGDSQIRLLTAHPNIEVRVFNPLSYRGDSDVLKAGEFIFAHRRVDFRMHNKLFIADNAVALIGGRNIGDQYFQVDPNGQFADDDLFVGGAMVQQLSDKFDEYWNSSLAIPIQSLSKEVPTDAELSRYRQGIEADWRAAEASKAEYVERTLGGAPMSGISSGALPLVWASARLMCDSPERKLQAGGAVMGSLAYEPVAQAALAAQTEFLMISPYFVPTEQELELLKDLRGRGVSVKILTNSLASTTEPAAHAGYARYRVQLLQMGVVLYELRPNPQKARGSGQSKEMSSFGNYGLHAKLYVFDRKQAMFGSVNFDQRSSRINTEVALIVNSPELGEETARRFQALTQASNAYQVVLQDDSAGKPHLVWRTEEDGRSVEYLKEPSRSVWRSMAARVLGILPIEHEL